MSSMKKTGESFGNLLGCGDVVLMVPVVHRINKKDLSERIRCRNRFQERCSANGHIHILLCQRKDQP